MSAQPSLRRPSTHSLASWDQGGHEKPVRPSTSSEKVSEPLAGLMQSGERAGDGASVHRQQHKTARNMNKQENVTPAEEHNSLTSANPGDLPGREFKMAV